MRLHGYKFTILERLRKLPVEDYEIAMRWLPEQVGITKGTFRNWIYTKAVDQLEIPASAILKMSVFFGCAPLEMFAYPFSPGSLLESWKEEKNQQNIANQQKLNFYETI